MKIKVNLKIILVLLTVVALFVIPTHVFAAEDINDFWDTSTGWEDLSNGTGSEGKETTEGTGTQGTGTGTGTETGTGTGNGTNTGTGTGTQNPTGQEKDKNTNNKPQSYDKAGIAEDTMMVVAVIALVMIAICAYNKVNKYKGI